MNDRAKVEVEDVSAQSRLSQNLLARMATALEMDDRAAIARLGERVEAAMRDYRIAAELTRPSPKDLRETVQTINQHYRGLYDGLNRIGPRERRVLDNASLEISEARRGRDGRFGLDESLAALQKIGILIREAERQLPKVKKGPQRDRARWDLVHRLGTIYAISRRQIDDDGTEELELPTRRHDAIEGQDYGPFRDFVIAVHDALGFENPERGVDDVIRSVCGSMGKKRRR